jgi:hypothetical protein
MSNNLFLIILHVKFIFDLHLNEAKKGKSEVERSCDKIDWEENEGS